MLDLNELQGYQKKKKTNTISHLLNWQKFNKSDNTVGEVMVKWALHTLQGCRYNFYGGEFGNV